MDGWVGGWISGRSGTAGVTVPPATRGTTNVKNLPFPKKKMKSKEGKRPAFEGFQLPLCFHLLEPDIRGVLVWSIFVLKGPYQKVDLQIPGPLGR